jgi:hypothetical protein
MQGTRHGNHLLDVIGFDETGAQEHPTKLDVVGDVISFREFDGLVEVAGENLDGHRCLFLADAGERLQAGPQLCGGRLVVPEVRGSRRRPLSSGHGAPPNPDRNGCLMPDVVKIDASVRFGIATLAYR